MKKERILITVKTYPTLSSKYDELVCTAGLREDGSWVRIYPIPFRKIDFENRFKKYQWISLELVRNTSDFRPESFRPYDYAFIDVEDIVTTGKDKQWAARKELVLKNVYTDLAILISEAKNSSICTSLATFKPSKILDFSTEKVSRDWDKNKLEKLASKANQLNLFASGENPFEVVKKVPYKFSYVLEDEKGRESKMMILDWEICQLFWRRLRHHVGDEQKACDDVKEMYWNYIAEKRDVYLYLGTTKKNHFVGPNPFTIIGVFYPPRSLQTSLF